MFSGTTIQKLFAQDGADVVKMQRDFDGCCVEMMFARRHIGKDMLTNEFYTGEDQKQLHCYDVPFSKQIFNHPLGGLFCVHDDNSELVPLFQRFYLMFDTKAIDLNLEIPDDDPLPKVTVLRSSGAIQDGWLKRQVSLHFYKKSEDWVPYIYINFLDSPEIMIQDYCKDFIRAHAKVSDQDVCIVDKWKASRGKAGMSQVVFEVVGHTQVKLTPNFVKFFIRVSNATESDTLREVEIIETILAERIMNKQLSLADFMRVNPTFNIKMKVHKLKVDEERDDTKDKMARILNQLLDQQVKVLQKHTMLTNMEPFFDLITVE